MKLLLNAAGTFALFGSLVALMGAVHMGFWMLVSAAALAGFAVLFTV
jgi:hypothetical protein